VKIGIAFEPNLIGIASQFQQFPPVLEKHLATATEKSAGIIGDYGILHMHFMEPSGTLAGDISVVMIDAYSAYTGSDLPYAPRREWGFSGKTDRLGRYYPNDPGGFFMTAAIEDAGALKEISAIYINAVTSAWQECIGNLPPGTSASVYGL
jgi:hypothetical protein